jgi:Cu(I)/Ag(I) efflux system periplasmic protein CusF
MKRLLPILAVAALFIGAAPVAIGQSGGMKGMDMKDMDMKGMDKKGQTHKGTGVVTNIDRAGGKVTLKHDPIKSLNWPTMTMAFAVKDKAMLDKLAKDKKVEFEFVQQGQQFVITSIK